jgi:hypothetical protein
VPSYYIVEITKYRYLKSITDLQWMSPRRKWDSSPTPSLASECAPPPRTKGGAHSPAGEGLGAVLRIRIRIHMFLDLQDLDPDPLVRGMIRIWILLWIRIWILLSSCKNSKKNLDSYNFMTLFDFSSLKNDVNVASKSNK